MRTKLFTLFLALAASAGTLFAASGTCGDNLTWDLTDGVLTISGTGDMDNWKSEYDVPWYSVNYNIRSVTIGNSVTSIGRWAFGGCSSLTSIEIPNSVTSIGAQAFYDCSGLTSVTIPNSVTSIGVQAFYNCSGLTSVTIPNSVTSIGRWAFGGCSSLTSIEIPNSVTSIGAQAFYDCSGLTSVTIPNSVTSIGVQAFYNCSGLTSVTIPNSVTSIGNWAFSGCYSLPVIENIRYADTYLVETVDKSLTTYTIQDGTKWVGDEAFGYCVNMTSISFPDGIIGAGNGVFIGDAALKKIIAPACVFGLSLDHVIKSLSYMPQNVDTIVATSGELPENAMTFIALSRKTLKSIDLSATTYTVLPDEAFDNYYNLTSLKLPANLNHIGYKMVAECVKLKSIDIPASVTEIDDRAFEDCRSIETITFGGVQPASVVGMKKSSSSSQLQRIGNWAFYNAHELQHLDIPEGVTEIGDGAFYGCTYLEDLVLPSSVQSIGDNCFALCGKLQKIVVNSTTPPTIEAKTFYDVKRQIPVYVPDNCVNDYKNDPLWGEFDIQGVSEMPEALESVSAMHGESTKLLHNGQILILRGDKTYTLTGQEMK